MDRRRRRRGIRLSWRRVIGSDDEQIRYKSIVHVAPWYKFKTPQYKFKTRSYKHLLTWMLVQAAERRAVELGEEARRAQSEQQRGAARAEAVARDGGMRVEEERVARAAAEAGFAGEEAARRQGEARAEEVKP